MFDDVSKERFWRKVDKRGPDDCWEWTAAKVFGYGVFASSKWRIPSHRYSLLLVLPMIFDGAFALHSCDNRGCVNPSHLRWGTRADNARDALERDRQPRGSRHGYAKLTEAMVLEIRSSNDPAKILAEKFGVTQSNIRFIIRRKTWRHV